MADELPARRGYSRDRGRSAITDLKSKLSLCFSGIGFAMVEEVNLLTTLINLSVIWKILGHRDVIASTNLIKAYQY